MRMLDPRPLPKAIALLLLVGFVYSGVATGREYRTVMSGPSTGGPAGSVDLYFRPAALASSQELREAIDGAGWKDCPEISLVVDMSVFSVSERDQLSFATSYLLYPSRVHLKSTEEIAAAEARGEAPRVIVVGRSNPFRDGIVRPVSPRLTLVTFR